MTDISRTKFNEEFNKNIEKMIGEKLIEKLNLLYSKKIIQYES